MTIKIIVRSGLIALAATIAAASEALPGEPVVIRSLPGCGAELVDPDVQEISVTFDHALAEGGWSWARVAGGVLPEITGAPHFLADRRTWVLPVRVRPGTAYALGLNYGKETRFHDDHAATALPWILRFTTGMASGNDPDQAILAQATQVADALVRGQLANVTARFDATMHKAINAAQLATAWQATTADYGEFKTFDPPYFKEIDGFRTAIVTGHWQHAAMNVQIVFDVEGRISGLLLRPATR